MEAEVVECSADNHGLDEPIWTDGSNEYLLTNLREGEFRDAISHRHEIGEDRESCHHDDVRQGETFQVPSHLLWAFLDIHEIARDDEEGRHHERENACLELGVCVAEAHDMNQYHENNEYGSYPVDVCIPLFHNEYIQNLYLLMLQLGANIHKIFFSSKSFCLKFPQILKILPVQVLKNCTARAESSKALSPGG